MGDDKKNTIFLLNYITKKSQGKIITKDQFNQYADDLGLKNLANNILLYYIYVHNSKPGVNWSEVKFDPKQFTLREKVIALQSNSGLDTDLFDEEMDDFFLLNPTYKPTNKGSVFFLTDKIVFEFPSYDNDIYLGALNLDYEDQMIISAAKSGECYEIDDNGGEEYTYMLQYFNTDNTKLLSDTLRIIGEFKLSNELSKMGRLSNTDNNTNDLIDQIVNTLEKKVPELNIIDDIFSEYRMLINTASCDSVEAEIKSHFPEGVSTHHGNEIWVTYDYMIKYLSDPEIREFRQMEDDPLISYRSGFDEAYYQYELDHEEFNRYVTSILENVISKIEDDDKYKFLNTNANEFFSIMDKLKFNRNDYSFTKKIGDVLITIQTKKINFEDKILELIYKKNKLVRRYVIPFDEISDYVYTEKLYENLLKRIVNR